MRARASITRPREGGLLSSAPGRLLGRLAAFAFFLAGSALLPGPSWAGAENPEIAACNSGCSTCTITLGAQVFSTFDVGLSTLRFNWSHNFHSTGTFCPFQAEISPNLGFSPIVESSRTLNSYVLFGTTGSLNPSTIYFVRVATNGFNIPFSTVSSAPASGQIVVASTSTLATIVSVAPVLPTPNSPSYAFVTTPTFSSSDTYVFQASTGDGIALSYREVWTQSPTHDFVATPGNGWLAGPDFRTHTAVSEGSWYLHVTGVNWAGVFATTQSVRSYVYDITPPTASNFRSVNAGSVEKSEALWNDKNLAVESRLTLLDPTAGLNTIGYSSGASPGYVGLYHLDEESGNRTFNFGLPTVSRVPSDNDGILAAEVGLTTKPYAVAGRFGSALNFTPAARGYVDLSDKGFSGLDPLDLSGSSFLTLSAWIKLNSSTGTNKFIVSRWRTDIDSRKYLLLVTKADGNPTPTGAGFDRPAFFYRQGGTDFKLIAPAGISTGVWTHLAVVVDAVGGAGGPDVSLYVNGQRSTSAVLGGSLDNLPSVPTLIGAGFGIPSKNSFFDGAIDEVKIFDPGPITGRATRAEEIALDYTSGHGWTPHVFVSTTGGTSWVLATSSSAGAPRWEMSPDPGHGVTSAATFKIFGADLGTSTSTRNGAGATNQVKFVLTDRAGNERLAGPFGILVDTTTPVSSNFNTKSSTGGPIFEAGWSPLAQGLTVGVTVQDITSGLDNSPGAFQVDYSTNNSFSFKAVTGTVAGPDPYLVFSATQSTNAPQTLEVRNLDLVQSVPEGQNRVRFSVLDLAGNVLPATQFVVRVDTTAPNAVTTLTALTPYASGQVQLSWTAPGNNRDLGTLNGAFHIAHTTTASQAEFLTGATAQIVISTQNVSPGSDHDRLVTGLLSPGVTYYFRIFARDPAGNFGALSNAATAVTLSPPSPPAGVVATVLGESSITVNWSHSLLTSTYEVFDEDTSAQITSFSTATASQYTRVGLSTNTAYGTQIRSINPAGSSAKTATARKFTFAVVPGTPTVSTVLEVTVTSITFSWDARGNPGNTRYEVTAATSADFATPVNQISFAQSLLATATTFAGLNPGASYYLRLRAENNEAVPVVTDFSPIRLALTRPTTAASVVGTALGVSSITWTWDSAGNGGATLYRVRRALDGTVLANNLDVHTTTFLQTGLATNTVYGVAVEVFVQTIAGGLTVPTTIFTLAARPGQPALLSATTGHLVVDWTKSGNPSYTRYEVTYSPDPGFAVSLATTASFANALTLSTTQLTALAPGTSYYFRVRAQNNDDQRPIPTAPLLTDFSATGLSPTVPVAITGVFTQVLTAESIKWHWNPNGNGGATQYKMTQPGQGVVNAAHNSSTFTRVGLVPNVFYDVEVEPFVTGVSTVALKSVATGSFSLANAPTSLLVVSVTSATATLSWNANSNSGPTEYQPWQSTDDFSANFGIPSFSSGTSRTLVNLAPFTTYFFKVRARNGSLINSASPEFSNTVSTFTLAPVIANLAGVPLGVSSISWTWDAVQNSQGYDVFMGSWSVPASSPLATALTSGFILSQLGGVVLSTNAAYGIKVRAFNFSGIGPLTPAVTRFTMAAEAGAPVVLPVSSRTVSLAWDLRGNPLGTLYELSQSVDGFAAQFSTPVAFANAFTAAATTLTNLASGATFHFRLRARNNDLPPVNTSFTAAVSTRTLGIPGTITDLRASGFFPGQVDLAWTSPGFNGQSGFITDGRFVVSVATFAGFAHSTFTVAGSTMVVVFDTSTAAGVQHSTSVTGLLEGSTFFLAVFTRNDEGVYSAASSTASQLAHRSVKAFTIDLGALAFGTLRTSTVTVSTTPAVLVSTGNVPVAFVISAATATPATPWFLADPSGPPGVAPTPAENQLRLFGAFHGVQPSSPAFAGAGIENIISITPAQASGSRFSIDQSVTGAAVPPALAPGAAQTRKLWIRLDTPPYTTTDSTQTIRISIDLQ